MSRKFKICTFIKKIKKMKNQKDNIETNKKTVQHQNDKKSKKTKKREENKKEKYKQSTLEKQKVSEILIENILKEQKILTLKKNIEEIKKLHKKKIIEFSAEIENIRKRNTIEIEKMRKFGLEKILLELLPVIDNLERTIETFKKENCENGIKQGIQLTLKIFLQIVKKFGLEQIYKTGVIFNPDLHQAVKLIKIENFKSNLVVKVLQKGYILNGRLIRAAIVTVSK
ncbi:nucleotide exchange factor GrpE [bacterium endosymbiont of Pedicinus badii]|uniref:nucleotide exchange factor GrpE n=1 Tax=bacterium endosymbiont of Pedicinus badii TaxID=1719126 RepID=UPI0009CF981A|nr:nucleotide exchange factor GrpE [bacterium endosymbiont of Pedicinus badii]OQM34499.1 hypothetical protein AOQ89_01265 [bacterium endosymbiont of Pedicinus badii]